MAIEPDLSYSWLPPSSSAPSAMEEVDLSVLAPQDLIPSPQKAVKSTPHIISSDVTPLNTLNLQEESFVLTPVTQPFQIQVCMEEDIDGERCLSSANSPLSVLQEPLNDPMLPFDSKDLQVSTPSHSSCSSSLSGVGPGVGFSSSSCLGSSHFSPLSVHSLADSGVSSISENTSERLLASHTPNYLDFDFDQIVEDVDDMFRERYEALERQKADDEDSAKTSDLIKRNMPPEYFFTYTSKDPEELAHDLAKSLVDKALESDRQKYIEHDPSVNVHDILENWTEVAGNRAMEIILDDLIECALNEISSSIFHGYAGNFSHFQKNSLKGKKSFVFPSEVLQDELDVLVSDILAESDESCLVVKKFGLHQISGPSRITDFRVPSSRQKIEEKAFNIRWKGHTTHVCSSECNKNRRTFITAKMRREAERKKRNRAGILVSSLKKKVYHCRCVDCQLERETQGVPEPSDSIEVKELTVPEEILPKEGIPLPRKLGRGRPRKYPRVEDFRRWFIEQERKKEGQSTNENKNDSYEKNDSHVTQGEPLVKKKRPRGRPPKPQVSSKAQHQIDNMSQKRPARSTHSKVNYIDCDSSSDEGYSEFFKDTTLPTKQRRLTSYPTKTSLETETITYSSNNTLHVKTANDIACVKPSVPQSGVAFPEDNYLKEMDLLQPEPYFSDNYKAVKTADMENSAQTSTSLISNMPSSLSIKKKESDLTCIIFKNVKISSDNSSSSTQSSVRRHDLKSELNPLGTLVCRSIQTDISFEINPSRVSSPPLPTKFSRVSASTSTDISVCTSTNRLIQSGTTHLEEQKGLSAEEARVGSQEAIHQNKSESNYSNRVPAHVIESLPKNQGPASSLTKKCSSTNTIKTYSRDRHRQSSKGVQQNKTGNCNEERYNLKMSMHNKEECTELLGLNMKDPSNMTHIDFSFGKPLSVNDVLLETDDSNERNKDFESSSNKSLPPSKATSPGLSSNPKVLLKRLSQGVIDSWCNRIHLGSLSSPQSVMTRQDSFNDEIYLMARSKIKRSKRVATLPLRQFVDDAVLPFSQDIEFLQASKPLPVYGSM